MSFALKSATVAVLALGLALPALAQDKTAAADTVLATVNGTEITLGHVIIVQEGLPDQYKQLPDDVLFQGILDQLVNQALLAADPAAQETLRVRLSVENERRALLAATAAEAIATAGISEEALLAAYSEQYANANGGEEYNAAHILVETEEEAKAIVAELEGGADFAAVARERSTGPSGPNGGALDWFGPGMMVEPFQQAVEALEVGQVSGPVQTQFGWHVIKLNDKRTKPAPAFEEVRDQLERDMQQKAVQDRLTELTDTATISRDGATGIDPALIRDSSLLEN
ncbi:MAG: peptidylprolyl isomerase [Roseivivax sp.]|nr:peptidylprolyl isomerase [Roseivivax sp.]